MTAVVVDALAARYGGTAFAAVQVARAMAREADVTVVARHGSLVADGLRGRVRLALLPAAGRGELARRAGWEAVALPALARRRGAGGLLSWSGMVPRDPGVPVVAYVTNPVAFTGAGAGNALRRLAIRRSAARGARVIVPTRAMAALAAPELGERPEVVPHGVDHDAFRPAARRGGEILCVADFYAHKRHDVVIAAWRALPAPRPALRLIGDPRVDPAAFARLAPPPGVIIEHHLPLRELVDRYHRAGVLVLASDQESFCLPVLEAAACGVPAVVRDLPALRETGGPSARAVDGEGAEAWARAIAAALEDGGAGARAAEHAAGYTWERTAAMILERLLR